MTSVSENVVLQVRAIDHFIGKNSYLMINQFIQMENFLTQENIPWMRLLCSRNYSARTDLFCAIDKIWKLVRYVDEKTFIQYVKYGWMRL